MPNRLIRDGFLDSQPVHNLTDAAECFYHRLLLAADDAGRMDGRLEVLRARLFPLDSSRRASDVEKQLRECVSEGLVIPYERESRPLVQVVKVQRSSPAVVSKFPDRHGSFRIVYVKRDTRDGEKEFVASSLPEAFGIPSPSLRDPLEPNPLPMYGGEGEGGDVGEGGGRVPRAAPTAASRGPSPPDLLRTWNENRGGLPEARELSEGRKRHAKAALAREPNLERWAVAVRRFARPHLVGQGWATFDFLLKPDSLTKIEEGKYDQPFGAFGRAPDPGLAPATAAKKPKAQTDEERQRAADRDREIDEENRRERLMVVARKAGASREVLQEILDGKRDAWEAAS